MNKGAEKLVKEVPYAVAGATESHSNGTFAPKKHRDHQRDGRPINCAPTKRGTDEGKGAITILTDRAVHEAKSGGTLPD